MNFELNLITCLAHTLVYESRQAWLPVGDAMGEDPSAPPPQQSTAETMRAYIQYLPQLMATAIPQELAAARAQLAAAQQTSPQMSQLQANIYRNTAPQLAQTSQQIDAANKLAGSQGDLAVLQGPGAQAARAVQGLSQEFDPEFYRTRAQASNVLGGLMSGSLTPGEEEAVSRRLAQQNYSMGLMGTPTSTSTVANAMQFGDAARQRQLQGVNAATSFLPVSRSGFDPTQLALGRPSINTGQSQFIGANQNAGQQGMDAATNMFNQIAGFENNKMGIDAQKRDWIDRVQQGIQVSI
jgi:hypothetical protein